jgi:hypothetical protein
LKNKTRKSESVASLTRPMRNTRLGLTGDSRTEAKSRAFLIFSNGKLRSLHSAWHFSFKKTSSTNACWSLLTADDDMNSGEDSDDDLVVTDLDDAVLVVVVVKVQLDDDGISNAMASDTPMNLVGIIVFVRVSFA